MMFCLKLFGRVSLLADGAPLTGPATQRRRLALLALLAAAPDGGVSREKLVGHLWPETDSEQARRFLADSIYTLRKALGPRAILGHGDSVRLNPEVIDSDVAGFREALARGDGRAAALLYQGPFLDGFFVPDAPEFDQWATVERERYARDLAQALEALAEEREREGDRREAVEWWRRLAAHDPYSSRVALRLMQALEAAGDPGAALRHARGHETTLRDVLDIAPDDEVVALAERLRASDPLPAARGGTATALARQSNAAPESDTAPTVVPDEDERSRDGAVRPLETPEEHVGAPGRVRPPWRGLAWAGMLVLLLGLVGAPALVRGRAGVERERVFVAVFDNQTADPALDPLGRMAADWVTQGLAQAGVAEVVPTITPFGLPEAPDSGSPQAEVGPQVIAHARQARAGTVVWGAYYRQGDSVLVQAHVTDVRTGRVVGGIPTVGGLADRPLEVVEALRRTVVAALAARFDRTVASLAEVSSQPPSFEAYWEYTQGVEHFLRSEYAVGLAHFDRAVALDSSFTMAAIWGAFARLNLGRHAQADSITQRLVPLREQLPPFDQTMLDALRATFRGDLAAQARATRAGAELAPGSFGQYAAAFYALRINRPREAIELLSGVDPDRADHRGWIWYWDVLTSAHHLLGEHRKELHAAREARKRYAQRLQPIVWEARSLAALGRIRELEETLLEQLKPFSGSAPGTALRLVAEELRTHGHSAASERLLEHAIAAYERLPSKDLASATARSGLAETLYRLGRYGQARELFAALAAEDPASIDYLGYLGVIAAREGHTLEAERIAAQLASPGRPYLFGLNTFWRARITALLGHEQDAVRLLQAAFAEGRPYSTAWHSEPDFESLRLDPAFRRLLRPAG